MLKSFLKKIGLALVVLLVVQMIAFAAEEAPKPPAKEPSSPSEATFKGRCSNPPEGFPPCATSPSECHSEKSPCGFTPLNCIFLEEPIGGKTSYDLFKKVACTPPKDPKKCPGRDEVCHTVLWTGGAIVGKDTGPFQAILVYEEGKEFQGPFGLLYNYLGLVYNFLSGIIIAFVVLIAIIGGIRMTVSGGDENAYKGGKDMIVKALIGMIIWFTASLILYTINPTFFAF